MKLFSFAARAALSAVVALALSASAQAGLLVKYDFENANNIASELDPEVLAGTFNGAANGEFSDGGFTFNETTASSEVEAPYVTLSMSALAGSALVLDRLVFDASFLGEVGQGTLGVRFVGNGSNFEQTIDASAASEFSISLAGVNVLNDTLKLYVYDNDGGAGTQLRIDNVQVYGKSVAGVPHAPEPSTLALLGLGAFGFGAAKLRRRRKNAAEA